MAIVAINNKTVTTAGTAVPLSATTVMCNWVLIQGLRANTGKIMVGTSGVLNTGLAGITLEIPVALAPLASVQLGTGNNTNSINLNSIYINSTVNAEGVNVLYETL